MSQIVEQLADISDHYAAAFVDLWGCVHDGVRALPDAVAALQAYRQRGGTVVLVTNSPRTRHAVERQITDEFGVAPDAWDTITTSGDSARTALFTGAVGRRVYTLSEEGDDSFFEPPAILGDPLQIEKVALEDAEGIVCTGPRDPHADVSAHKAELMLAKQMGLKLLCANPDIVVDRGERREWCAGAVARYYTELGGESLYFGKPHPPIYDLARRRLAAMDRLVPDSEILCIGDGILTDIAGAMGEGLDSLFITGGLARDDTDTERQPDPQALARYLNAEQSNPTYSIGYLR